jgi:hypothetical protein
MMWRIALAAWLTAALSLFALNAPRAQFNGCMAGFCSPAVSTTSYSGPGDIASGAIAFYNVGRAYNLAYAQALSAAADLVDTATGLVTGTMHFLSTGFVNKTELTGGGQACQTACSITKLYDQTGNGNHVVQATLANMPGLTFNAQNGLPCLANNAGQSWLQTAGTISQAVPFTETAVAERTGSFTTAQRIAANGNGVTGSLGWSNSANSIVYRNGTVVTLTAADSAFHALLGISSNTAPLFAVDSSANTSTSSNGTNSLASNEVILNTTAHNAGLVSGFVCERGIWPADLNSSYQAMLANMRSATNGWNF